VGETAGVSEMEVVLYRKKSVVSEIYTECVHSATAYLLLFPSAPIIFVHAQSQKESKFDGMGSNLGSN